MSYDEVLRRTLVAMARRAGTLIRIEELKRQALTASINRPLAEALLKEIDDILRLMPDFEHVIKSAVERASKEGKPLLDTVLEDAIKSLIGTIPLALIGTLDKMKRIVANANEIIKTTNRIIEELSKEGIHLPKIELIKSKDDVVSLSLALRTAKQRLQTIVEFLKELEKYGEEKKI